MKRFKTPKSQNPLKHKIMTPFIVIIAIMAITSICVALYTTNKLLKKELQNDLDKEQHALQNQLGNIQTHFNTLSTLSVDNNIETLKEKLQTESNKEDRRIWKWENLIVSQNSQDLSPLPKEGLSHVELEFHNAPTPIILKHQRRKNETVITLSYIITKETLNALKSDEKSSIALLYTGNIDNKDTTDMLYTSPELDSVPEIKKELKNLFKANALTLKTPANYTLRSGHQEYEIQIDQSPLTEGLYIAVIKASKQNGAVLTELILSMLSLFSIIGIISYLIYNTIIQKLTLAIEELVSASKKITKGKLNETLPIENHTELTELSEVFNDMILNLNEYAQNLQKETQRSEAIISSIPEAIIVTDLDNRLIVANRHAEEMFNFSINKVQGKFLLEYINNKDLVSVLNKKKKRGLILTEEVTIPDTQDQNRMYSLSSSLVENRKEEAIGVITILRDQTHKKQIDSLRDGFLRTVSHELRTPLTSVIGFIELVKTTANLTEEQQNYLTTSLKEASNLKSLIDDLLDLSQITAGKARLHLEKINVKELIDDVTTTLSPIAKGKKLKLMSLFSEETLTMHADLPKVRRVLLNLLSNAIKFTEKGEITLDAKETEDSIEFSVKDTGIGLKEDEKEIIFEKFRQIDYSDKRKYEGIGLGLSIVKQLVELHNGEIKVESEYEKGATFTFTIKKNLNKHKKTKAAEKEE